MIGMEEDSKGTVVNDDQLARVATVAKKLLAKQRQIAETEEYLRINKEQLEHIEERELPDLMQEIGMAEFAMESGEKISIKQYYSARITPENGPECYAWLRGNGFGDLIKHEIIIGIPMGKDDESKSILSAANAQGLKTVDKEIVHPATLTSFVKEQIENGAELPLELFKAYVGRKAKVTPPKTK